MSQNTFPLQPERYLSAIEENSLRLGQALAAVPIDTPVPPCPGWTARHLLDHLAVVQHFWAGVVREGLTQDAEVEALRHRDPLPDADDLHGQLDLLRSATGELTTALRSRAPEDPAWSWAPDQTVGFIYRRQAHEACVHRIDAELTASPGGDARTLVDPLLAADGVDEVLRLVAGDTVPSKDAGDRLVRIVASDTGTTWLVTVHAGTPGEAGAGSSIEVADDDPADGSVRPTAILTGTAEDLLCALWGRPPITDPHRTGDLLLLGELETIVTQRLGG